MGEHELGKTWNNVNPPVSVLLLLLLVEAIKSSAVGFPSHQTDPL